MDTKSAGPRGPAPAGHKYAREVTVDRNFSLARHLAQVLGLAAAIAAFGWWLARDAAPWVWASVPVFLLVSNAVEWLTHRFPMHRPLWPRMMYVNHALVHHNAFAGDDQEIRGVTELSLVMMPWYTLLFVFLGASPVALVAGLVGGAGLAGVFYVSAILYFLAYETIHTLHHLPRASLDNSRWGRSRTLAFLRAHHHHHHQLERMGHVNFNVTFPLTDRLMGTYEAPRR